MPKKNILPVLNVLSILLFLIKVSPVKSQQLISFYETSSNLEFEGFESHEIEGCNASWLFNPFSESDSLYQTNDICYHPNENVYMVGYDELNPANQNGYIVVHDIWEIDLNNQEMVKIGTDSLTQAVNLTIGSDGTIYVGGDFNLQTFDPVQERFVDMGKVGISGFPVDYVSAMTFLGNELYAYARGFNPFDNFHKFIKINIDEPMYSTPIAEYDSPNGPVFHDMTTVNLGCDSSFIYVSVGYYNNFGDAGIYKINELDGSLTYLCDFEEIIASPSAHTTFDCIPILDLDPSASGLEHQAGAACAVAGIPVPIFSTASPSILTNTIVDSVWVSLTGGMLDDSEESLNCFGGVGCNELADGLMIRNNNKLPNEEFMTSLQLAVGYSNNAVPLSEGVREITVVPYHKDYAGDTATLFLPVAEAPDAGLPNDLNICADGEAFSLFDQLGGQPDIDGTWTYQSAATDDVFNPLLDQSGEYTYTVSGGICPDEMASVSVHVNLLPEFSLGGDAVLCDGEMVTVLPSSSYDGASFVWQDGSILSSFEIALAGEYWLEVTDTNGCQWRDTLQLTTSSAVQTDSLLYFCEGDSLFFMEQWYFEGTEQCWDHTSATGCDSIFCLTMELLPAFHQEVSAELPNGGFQFNGEVYNVPGTYQLNLQTQNGCDSLFTLLLSEPVAPDPSGQVYVPNAFSPNGDGTNDRFMVFPSWDVEVLELMVFDRWGNLVYNGTGVGESGWDGQMNGKDVGMGAYAYLLRLRLPSGLEKVEHGVVQLLR